MIKLYTSCITRVIRNAVQSRWLSLRMTVS